MSSTTLLVVLIAANTPLYYLTWRLFFGSMEEFLRCLRFVLIPDIVSMFRGQWGEDQLASLKFVLWAGICVGAVFLEYRYFMGEPVEYDPNLPAEAPL